MELRLNNKFLLGGDTLNPLTTASTYSEQESRQPPSGTKTLGRTHLAPSLGATPRSRVTSSHLRLRL